MAELLMMHEPLSLPSPDEIMALIKARGLGDGGSLTPLVGGHHNDVFRSGTIVARHPKNAAGIVMLRQEYDALVQLGGRRFPKAIDYAHINGTPVAFIEYIEGNHVDFNLLASDDVQELAAAMAELHERTTDRFSAQAGAAPTERGAHAEYLKAMVCESVIDRLARLDTMGIDQAAYDPAYHVIGAGLQRLDELLRDHPDEFSGTTFSLLHHDINPENVLWGPDGHVTFIDPNPTYGDPLDDINYAVSNNGGSAEFEHRLLAAYSRAAGLDNISRVRMGAYTIKNGLDDLVWTMEMREQSVNDTDWQPYDRAYASRLATLQQLLTD